MNSLPKPSVLFVFYTHTQQSLRVAEAMAGVLRERGCDVTLAGIEFTDPHYARKFGRFPFRHAVFDLLTVLPAQAATAAGAAAGAVLGKFAKHRVQSGIAEKMDTALPPGSGGVIAVYDIDGAEAVDRALANAVKKSVAQIDGTSAKELKAGLAEAQAGMGG